jgi:hypothetical protein
MDALHKALPKGNTFQMMHVLNRFSAFFDIMASLFKTYRSPYTVLPSSMNGVVMLRDFIVETFLRHDQMLASTCVVPVI